MSLSENESYEQPNKFRRLNKFICWKDDDIDFLNSLPVEIWTEIVNKLNPIDFMSFRQTCLLFYKITNTPFFLKNLDLKTINYKF